MSRSGLIGAVTTTALLLAAQYAVLYCHPQHSISTIVIELSAMGMMFGAICGFLKWRDLI